MTIHVVDEIKAIIAGLVGGAKYGFKIRVPHALVMTFLFRRDLSSQEKIKSVTKLAAEHASNLASFAALYKTILLTLKFISRSIHRGYITQTQGRSLFHHVGRTILTLLVDGPMPIMNSISTGGNYGGYGHRLVQRPPGHPERSYHALLAGSIGGYFIWGRYSAVNYQIVLYLTSRVIVGTMKRIQQQYPTLQKVSFQQSYPYFAALIWGLVMVMFEEHPDVLNVSLRRSMNEIYRYDSMNNSNSSNKNSNETRKATKGHRTQAASVSRLVSSSLPLQQSSIIKNV